MDERIVLPEHLSKNHSVIIIGYNSMIASRYLELSKRQASGVDVVVKDTDRLISTRQLDLTVASEDEILKTLESNAKETLLHFAAFTDVDAAEKQRGDKNGTCWLLNVRAVSQLANACKKMEMTLVNISTDYVFDGKNGPYSEEDQMASSLDDVSWYGWSKREGEEVIRNSGCKFLIVRTAYPYRAKFEGKLDFVRNILAKLRANNLYPMFVNQFLTPTFIDNFAQALDLLLDGEQTGTWHVVDNTTLSAYEAAVLIADVFVVRDVKIAKGDLLKFQDATPTLAKRPANGGLKNDKLRAYLTSRGFAMQDFGEALSALKKQMEVAG